MTNNSSRVSELAALIATHTERVNYYLASNNLPFPSFAADAPTDLQLPPEIEQSRIAALEASQELNDLLQKPRDYLFNHQHNILLYLKLISRFDLASKIPINDAISYKDISRDLGIDEAAVARILRLGIAYRVFLEPKPGYITHSAASRQIADDPRVAAWVGANVDEMWPAAQKVVDALNKWPQAAEPNHTGFNLAHGTEDSFYQALGKDPNRARRFGGAMSFFTTGEGYALHHLTDAQCWKNLATASSPIIVDLGGSYGDAAFALTRKYSNFSVVVQELPEIVADCKEIDGLKVSFMSHDFFQPQPVKDADVFLCRWTMHNWSDKYCLQILRALIPALKQGARVIIMDFVMPPFGVIPNSMERKLRAMDVTMLEIGNAKERDLDEWKALFSKADSRFNFSGVESPPGSNLSLLELTWSG